MMDTLVGKFKPLGDLEVHFGDLVTYMSGNPLSLHVTRVSRNPGPPYGMYLGFHTLTKRFDSPEELALFLETGGERNRIVYLNFIPDHMFFRDIGKILPYFGPYFGKSRPFKEPGYREFLPERDFRKDSLDGKDPV